jgi:hypothetical protein
MEELPSSPEQAVLERGSVVGKSRYAKTKLSSFEQAVQRFTQGLSEEASQNLTSMVKDVATEFGYNDTVMRRRLLTRLNHASKSKNTWASEVLEQMNRATA